MTQCPTPPKSLFVSFPHQDLFFLWKKKTTLISKHLKRLKGNFTFVFIYFILFDLIIYLFIYFDGHFKVIAFYCMLLYFYFYFTLYIFQLGFFFRIFYFVISFLLLLYIFFHQGCFSLVY